MLIKPVILGGQYRLLELLGRSSDLNDLTALFAKFANQEAISAVYPEGNFRTVIGQRFK
jgi:hypothetical protein